MPVTAKLSRLLYDRLGDEIADEIVTWFNAVESSSRGDLREFNELNFARFDATLRQQLGEMDLRVARATAELNAKIDRVATELDAKIDRVGAELQTAIANLDAKMERRMADLIKWSFVFWAGAVAAVAAMAGLLR